MVYCWAQVQCYNYTCSPSAIVVVLMGLNIPPKLYLLVLGVVNH